MRRVLFIAHRFPPTNASGVYRSAKFVKYLPRAGWQPYVITTDCAPNHGQDPSLLADVPSEVRVWRVPTPRPQPVNQLASWLHWKPRPDHRPADLTSVPSARNADSQRPTMVMRMRRAALWPLYLVQKPPIDADLYWSMRIVPLARHIVEDEKIDVVLTTSPPWSAMLSGLLLQRMTGTPWVVDMRDPWTTALQGYQQDGLGKRVDQWIERVCLSRASAVIGVTQPWVADLRHLGGRAQDGPGFFLITNGFDPDDFASIPSHGMPHEASRIQLYHPGSVHEGGLATLLKGVEALQLRKTPLNMQFSFVGHLHPRDLQLLAASPACQVFRTDPERVSHAAALKGMRESHVLLLTLSFDHYPGKLFEYMHAGRPILAITPDGVASDLIRQSGTGCIVSPDDPDRLASILEQIETDYTGFVTQYYHPNWDVIDQYDRRALTEQLGQVLEWSMTDGG